MASMIHEVNHHASTEMAKKRGTNGEKEVHHVSFDLDIYKKSPEHGKDHSSRPNDAKHYGDNAHGYRAHGDKSYGEKAHADKPLPAEDKATQQANVSKMLDSNTSAEDKVKLASHMYEHGQRAFDDSQGHKYQISEGKVGDKKIVGVFTTDEKGHDKGSLRGIVNKDGSTSQQQDQSGKKVDYQNDWSKKHDGGGLYKAPEVEKGTDARDGSQYERRKDGHGGSVETHSGDKTEQNYTKTDDGKGNILVHGKDGTGYARTEQPGGAYNEAHFGPNPSDNYIKSGDGKGNDVESRKYADGNSIEKYSFQNNPNNNFTREHHTDNSQTITDAKGNKTSISPDGNTTTTENIDGTSIKREKNQNGFTETHKGPGKGDNYSIDYKSDGAGNTVTTRDDGNGHSVESRTYPDSSKNYKKETFADNRTVTTDGKGTTEVSGDGKTTTFKGNDGTSYTRTKTGDKDYTEKHDGPSPEDEYSVDHSEKDGATKDKFSYSDASKDYSKEVSSNGKTTLTDSVGLKASMISGSKEFQDKTWKDIESLPANERKAMADKGIHYNVAGIMSDIDPKYATEHPRGWPDNKTWNDAEGGYDSSRKQVNLAERTNAGPSHRLGGVLRHESGHAVDDALGQPSHSDEFDKAYQQDAGKIKNPFQMTYLRQQGDAGKEETFAEVYGALRGSSANPSQTQEILNTFPEVAKVVQHDLDGLPK